jgi:hypothetical protein
VAVDHSRVPPSHVGVQLLVDYGGPLYNEGVNLSPAFGGRRLRPGRYAHHLEVLDVLKNTYSSDARLELVERLAELRGRPPLRPFFRAALALASLRT